MVALRWPSPRIGDCIPHVNMYLVGCAALTHPTSWRLHISCEHVGWVSAAQPTGIFTNWRLHISCEHVGWISAAQPTGIFTNWRLHISCEHVGWISAAQPTGIFTNWRLHISCEHVGWVSAAQPTGISKWVIRYRFSRTSPMSEYRRWYIPGGTSFFTVVTEHRIELFQDVATVKLLGRVMRKVRSRYPFRTVAMVVLPDHLHCVWTLPRGDEDFSSRWRWIKGAFTEEWLASGATAPPRTASRQDKGEHAIWQRRFWEHQIRDEQDLEKHVDYIHYNPVKHGHATRPADWPWSSFRRHVRLGHYPSDWGNSSPDEPFPSPAE